MIRGLAMALRAAAGRLLPLDNVQSAFSARSKMLVTSDFVETYLGEGRSAHAEAEALIWLTENIIGATAKREAGRWLSSLVFSLRFEKEYGICRPPARALPSSPACRGRRPLRPDRETVRADPGSVGEIGGPVQSDNRTVLTRCHVAPPLTATVLRKLACGETAPWPRRRQGNETLKLARHEDLRPLEAPTASTRLKREPSGLTSYALSPRRRTQ